LAVARELLDLALQLFGFAAQHFLLPALLRQIAVVLRSQLLLAAR